MTTIYHALTSYPCDAGERNDGNTQETILSGQTIQNAYQNQTLKPQHFIPTVIVRLRQPTFLPETTGHTTRCFSTKIS